MSAVEISYMIHVLDHFSVSGFGTEMGQMICLDAFFWMIVVVFPGAIPQKFGPSPPKVKKSWRRLIGNFEHWRNDALRNRFQTSPKETSPSVAKAVWEWLLENACILNHLHSLQHILFEQFHANLTLVDFLEAGRALPSSLYWGWSKSRELGP